MTLCTPHELCDALRISRSTLHRLRKAGLPSIGSGRLIRFDEDASLKWFAQFSHLTSAPEMLSVGDYECRVCHFEDNIPEPMEATRLGRCPQCGTRQTPTLVGGPASV